jgi:hypothetical protein
MSKYKESTAEATVVWQKYEKGVDHHNKLNLYSNTETYFDMVEGDQWKNIESGDEKLSSHDFISGVVEHKVAMVAMNAMTINYSPLNTDGDQAVYQDACEKLNAYAASKWELTKMDIADWEAVNAACITGDSYLFFYNSNLDHQMIDRTNIYFADEQEKDIQKQKRTIIYERRFVDDVKEDARNNGIDEQEIESIVADDDTDTLPTAAKQEVENDKKCSCLLCIERKPLPAPNAKPFGIFISRSTKTVVYQPATQIEGLTKIPIAKMMWYPKRGSSRGIGEVKRLLNNQINSNKLLYRREESIKMSAFPKPVVSGAISNPEDAKKVGVVMKMKDSVLKIGEAFGYVSPQSATSEPKELQEEYISMSRDLANAGDNATGNINPEQASGAAIIAVKDQQAIATNKPQAYHRQFIEDIAAIWLDTWVAYNPNGMTIDIEQDGQLVQEEIPAEVLQSLNVNIRIDVSPTNPYSKFAREQSLENALANQHITFDEYVEALDDDGTAPKGKFKDILDKRAALAEQQALMQEQSAQAQLEQAMGIIDQLNQELAQGGMPNV